MSIAFGKAGIRALVAFAVIFLVQAGYGQSFTVSAVPSSLTIYPGQQNLPVAITLGASTYTGPVSITMTGLPSGITVTPLSSASGGTGTLNLSASLSAGQEGFPPSYPSQNTSWTAQAKVVAAAGSPRPQPISP